MEIRNTSLVLRVEPDTGLFSLGAQSPARTFATGGKLSGAGGTAKVVSVSDRVFGEGAAIDVTYPNGNRDRIMLFQRLPFALFRSELRNGGAEPTVTEKVQALTFAVDLGRPVDALKVLGTGGLAAPGKRTGSYMWLAAADPQSRVGVVGGWLTSDRGSGVVFAEVRDGQLRMDAQIDYGRLRIAPGKSETLETFALGFFDDARLGLEAWADAVAKVYNIRLPPQPVVYCTWYHAGASNEKALAKQAAFAADNLAPYGFSVVQIDDGWQDGDSKGNGPRKNFTTHRPNGPYPSGMEATADDLRSKGLVPGIWFMPFAGTHNDPWFAQHQDWFVKRADGKPYDVRWGGTCLDMTHPGAREHLRGVVRRIAHEWGYRYLKLDGLWTGSGTEIEYVNDAYKDDHIGNAVFHNPDKTNVEAYRDGLKLVRETAGRDVFLLGCCAPQNMRSYGGAFGLVDAMRIGPDNGVSWDGLLRGPTYGSRNYHLNGRIWYNDPDPLYVRANMPLEHVRAICSWVTITGQLNAGSDSYADLPAERLDILRRTMPSHGLRPRPVDLFEQKLPRIWLLTDERRTPRRDVIGLFNWGEEPWACDYPLERIGLSREAKYVALDFWANALVGPLKGNLRRTVPPQSCEILAVRPMLDRPVLIGTSRHITQGIVDVLEEKWNADARELTGLSKVVAGDPYELRVVTRSTRGDWKTAGVEVSDKDRSAGVTVSTKEEPGLVRATLQSPQTREVSWKVRFDAQPAGEAR